MKLFAIFHLNLMFSSIPEENRKTVIQRCYWPILRLIEDHGFPIGLELSGITLETIVQLDPLWIELFRSLLHQGKVECVGSGYSQLIGPLVPASVNRANLRIGNDVYERILGVRPRLALVNEQAWSAGLVEHYCDAGYAGIFMDYDNPAQYADWPESLQHYPQRAQGITGNSIPVVWSRSIVFQKLQRLAHGELEQDEYLNYIENLHVPEDGWLPIYGNDAEIFDYRPGRFSTEAQCEGSGEWDIIATTFHALHDRGYIFHLPSQTLDALDHPQAGKTLALTSAEQPVPVKKQLKYNICRWAVTGKNDFRINSKCRAIADALEQHTSPSDDLWRELCYCWSSDFRTHITPKRFSAFTRRLDALYEKSQATQTAVSVHVHGRPAEHSTRFFNLHTDSVRLKLNTAKGLAIDAVGFATHNHEPYIGTLEHGYFNDIRLGADFFSGHCILEGPGIPKETDLVRVIPLLHETQEYIQAACTILLHSGTVHKVIRAYNHQEKIDIRYAFDFPAPPTGTLRLGHITLFCKKLSSDGLFYQTANGGPREVFPLQGQSFDHGNNVSFLVSSSHAAGMTDAECIVGGKHAAFCIKSLAPEHAFVAVVSYQQASPAPFFRIAFSMQEMDDTSSCSSCSSMPFTFSTGFSITPFSEALSHV